MVSLFKAKTLLLLLIFISCRQTHDKELPIEKMGKEYTREIDKTARIKNYKSTIDSINKSSNWIKTKFGLWKSKNNDLGLKTREVTNLGIVIDKYIKHLSDGRPLAKVLDTVTFKYLGSSFYKDKNNIYTHYEMADGGSFWIVDDADPKTFKVIGDCYAKDKNYIFGERAMKMDSVDYKTFKTCEACGCYAKDKNGYYFWDENVDLKDITEKEIIEKLNGL